MDTTETGATPSAQPAAMAIPNPLPTTLTSTDVVVGTGAEAKTGNTVTVNYVGMLPDGTVFDASANHGQAFSFPLGGGRVIKGWDQGVVGMKVGGKRRLIIPADLAYGNQSPGAGIPANATLIFDIELVGVK
jgi:FKBP-type peptidyl-prolyl cis-trans isomerase